MSALLLEAGIRSALLWIALWVALRLLQVRDARVEKLAWTIAAAASLAMPALMQVASLAWTARVSIAITGSAPSPALLDGARHVGLATTLLWGYVIVAAGLLLRFFANLVRALRLYHRARRPAAEILPGIAARVSDEIHAPCTFGRSVLLPGQFTSWSPAAQAAALAHERSHVIDHDGYRVWLATLYSCIFWFNPTAWMIRRRLQLLAELTSDQAALHCVGDSTSYAELLVQLAAHASPLRTAIAMSGGTHLAARITCILENGMNSDRLSKGRKAALLSSSVAATLICIGCASGPHVLTSAEDPKVSWVSGAPLGDFYPAALRHNGVQGTVDMKLTIDPAGRVINASVVSEDPADSGFGPAATDAARTFVFDNTLARPVIKTLRVRFALKD